MGGFVFDRATTPETGRTPGQEPFDNTGWRCDECHELNARLRLHCEHQQTFAFPRCASCTRGRSTGFAPNPDLKPETLLGMEGGFTLNRAFASLGQSTNSGDRFSARPERCGRTHHALQPDAVSAHQPRPSKALPVPNCWAALCLATTRIFRLLDQRRRDNSADQDLRRHDPYPISSGARRTILSSEDSSSSGYCPPTSDSSRSPDIPARNIASTATRQHSTNCRRARRAIWRYSAPFLSLAAAPSVSFGRCCPLTTWVTPPSTISAGCRNLDARFA